MQDVVLVTIDSLRADHLGSYGYDRDTTPRIDELAAEGVRFNNAFAHACFTRASFPAILTSTHGSMYGGCRQIVPKQTLISEEFFEAGYRTAGFHSNPYLREEFGYSRGFETFFDGETDPSISVKARQFVKDRFDSNGIVYRGLDRLYSASERHAGANVGSPYVDATELTDKAIDWIRMPVDKSRFLWVHYMDAHHPYAPPERYQRFVRDEPISKRRAVQLRRKMLESPEAVTEAERTDILDLYDAEVRYTDAEIGRLVDTVRQEWGEDTVIAVTSDHGDEFGDHGGYSHHSKYYDELLHVPLVYVDGTRTGEVDELVGLLDLAPTLLDAAEISVPDRYSGWSLLQLLEADQWPRESITAGSCTLDPSAPSFCYRTTDWKYIHRDGNEELYDLVDDPSETTDVSDERPAKIKRFRARLDEYVERVEATNVETSEVDMDEDVQRRLRALGYRE